MAIYVVLNMSIMTRVGKNVLEALCLLYTSPQREISGINSRQPCRAQSASIRPRKTEFADTPPASTIF